MAREWLTSGADVHQAALRVVARMVAKGLDDSAIRAWFAGVASLVEKARGEKRVHELLGRELDRMIDGARGKYAASESTDAVRAPLFRTFTDLLSSARAPEWAIDGIAELDSVGVLLAESGNYKTFLDLDWSLHIAAGKAWYGRAVKQGAAFYVCGEGHGGLARRLTAWKIRHQISDAPFFATRREVFIDDPVAVQATSDEIAGLAEQIKAKPVMIVIDTLARNMSGDESATVDMNRFVAHASGLRARFGAFVLVVHHPGHTEKTRERGAYSLRGAVDTRFLLTRPEGTELEARLEFAKVKDGETPLPLTLRLAKVELGIVDSAGVPVTSLVVNQVDEVEASNTRPLTAADRAFQALREAIEEQGEILPKIAGAQRVVNEKTWLKIASRYPEFCLKNEQSLMRQWRRAKTTLTDEDSIRGKRGWFWLHRNSRTCPRTDTVLSVRTADTPGGPYRGPPVSAEDQKPAQRREVFRA